MKKELKKYPKMQLVDTVYGNDDPTTATQVTQGLLQQYPDLKGIISPTTVGIAGGRAVLDTSKYKGKIALTGLGTPEPHEEVRQGRHESTRSRCGTRRTSATSPPTPRLRSPPGRSPARPATRSPPASSATSRSARTAPSCSASRSCSTRTSTTSTSDHAPVAGPAASGRPPEPRRTASSAENPDGPRLLHRPGPARPARRVQRAARGRLAGDAGGAARRRAGTTTRCS